MNPFHRPSVRSLGIGLLSLLASLPLLYSQHPQKPQQPQHQAPAQKSRPPSTPVQHAGPAVVTRTNHGTVRHVDATVIRPQVREQRHDVPNQHVIVHRDVDVDIGRTQYWHSFSYGARRHGLRAGYLRLFVGGMPFFYDDGIYFQMEGGDYQEVYPPIGAVVKELPDGVIEIESEGALYYYAGGAFYVRLDDGFVIVPPPMGIRVPELPPGAGQISIGGSVAFQFNGIYFRPVFIGGATHYTTFRH
jgi:hypothetical protein